MKIVRFRALALACASLCLTVFTLRADSIQEDFSVSPETRGWKEFGHTNLFSWDSTNQNLQVTWDSSFGNSYFYRPLGTILTRDDDFSFSFDVHFDEFDAGSFELAVGFLNFANASSPSFVRGTGPDSPNMAEFDYFPDYTSIDATIADTNSILQFTYDFSSGLNTGQTYRVTIRHAAGDGLLTGEVRTNGNLYTALPFTYTQTNFTDFRLDTFSISSYDGTNSFGELYARGIIDNINLTLPPPPVSTIVGSFSNESWQVQFLSRSNWLYTLQRSIDLQSWSTVSSVTPGTGSTLVIQETNSVGGHALYRVSAARP